MESMGLITGDVNPHCLDEVVSAWCLQCKVTIFPCVTNKYLRGRGIFKYSVPPPTFALILASSEGSYLWQILL